MTIKLLTKYSQLLILLTLFCVQTEVQAAPNTRYKKIETKADKTFVRGDYKEAMKLYEQAQSKAPQQSEDRSRLELKIARLSTLLQDPEMAIKYYGSVNSTADTMMTVNDVCFFIDALRQSGDQQQAEIIARNYAFKGRYSRNQRYLNTLQSLSNQQHYYGKGSSDFAVELTDKSSKLPEYWIGSWRGQSFYAVSNSKIQDPLKIYYHRTQFFTLNDRGTAVPFTSIPRELQSGPVAFNPDAKLMVATQVIYRDKGRKVNPGHEEGMFLSQLTYSTISTSGNRWSSPRPMFVNQEFNNYAHPTFFNEGRSIVFSSDMPGTLGGMDLFICHWDEATKTWSNPVNLGPTVNTEGNEIYPLVSGDALYFSSNGHAGFGGYDIYKSSFRANRVLSGSLFHYPFPVNSTFNDFETFFDGSSSYFISDRRGKAFGDDIYTFDNTASSLNSVKSIGVSDEFTAMTGNLGQVKGLLSSSPMMTNKEISFNDTSNRLQEGEVLLSIYFNFDSSRIDAISWEKLHNLMADPSFRELREISILGYADEFGATGYNKTLSEKRALAVADLMIKANIAAELIVEGRGMLLIDQSGVDKSQKPIFFNNIEGGNYDFGNTAPTPEQISLTQVARRVDIIVKK